MPEGVVFGIIALVVVGVVVLALYGEKVKRERLVAFAAATGWSYERNPRRLVGRWRGHPFNLGSSKKVSHLLTGTFQGHDIAAFEYQYTTGSGKNRSTTVLTVTMVALPTYLPDLQITNEGFGARLAKAFGGQDIQFESEEFNRRWRVEAAVRKTAHDVVHPRFMEYMVAGPPDPLRFEGTDLWSWHTGALDTARLHARLSRLVAVVGLVPRHVWQDYGYDPHAGAGGAQDSRGY